MAQGTRWVFTLNNYSDDDLARLNELDVKYLVYGKEVGESGTPHLQGFCIFNSNKRFNAAKAAIGARCHLEVSKGTSEQASQYCKKDGNFVERGDFPSSKGKRNDWEQYKLWVIDLGRPPTKRELATEWTSLFARYRNACFDIAEAVLPSPELTTTNPRVGWQTELESNILRGQCRRKIDFYVNQDGNAGKSWFCRYAVSRWPDEVQVLRIGRRDDLAFAIDVTKRIFLFDVPRTQMTFLQYSILEMLKDQMIFSPKYESQCKILRHVPYVVVFSNEPPDMDALTDDRYNVINI